jgi:hypothetical protein
LLVVLRCRTASKLAGYTKRTTFSANEEQGHGRSAVPLLVQRQVFE